MIKKWDGRRAFLIRPNYQHGNFHWAVESGTLRDLRMRAARLIVDEGEQPLMVRLASANPDKAENWHPLELSFAQATEMVYTSPSIERKETNA